MKTITTIDYIVRNTWLKIAKMYNNEASKFNSTMVNGFTLLSIDPKTGTPSTKLGPKMGIQPTSLSRTIKNLEALQLIERIPSSKDKRSVIIKLTPQGLLKRNISKQIVLNFNDKVINAVSKEDLEAFIRVAEAIQKLED